jgi:hypothetical protein
MARCLRFDAQDKAVLRALDDFTISADGETATVAGEMEIKVVRPDGDQFWLTITLPGGEELDVRIRRAQLLERLDIEADESRTVVEQAVGMNDEEIALSRRGVPQLAARAGRRTDATSNKGELTVDSIATFHLEGATPYLPNRFFYFDRLPNESHADHQQRIWREHLHVDRHGEVFIPLDNVERCFREAAKFLGSSPGGFSVIKPIMLGVKAKDVTSETIVEPNDSRKWLRPILPVWGGDVEIIVHDEPWLQPSQRSGNTVTQDIVEYAGEHLGFGTLRPKHNGTYGKFIAREFTITTVEAMLFAHGTGKILVSRGGG